MGALEGLLPPAVQRQPAFFSSPRVILTKSRSHQSWGAHVRCFRPSRTRLCGSKGLIGKRVSNVLEGLLEEERALRCVGSWGNDGLHSDTIMTKATRKQRQIILPPRLVHTHPFFCLRFSHLPGLSFPSDKLERSHSAGDCSRRPCCHKLRIL